MSGISLYGLHPLEYPVLHITDDLSSGDKKEKSFNVLMPLPRILPNGQSMFDKGNNENISE